MYLDLLLFFIGILAFSAISRPVEKGWITGPMLFIGFGFIIGNGGFGLLSFSPDSESLKLLAELTLAIVLFNDASGLPLKQLVIKPYLPARLLLIGLPLTLGISYFIGTLIFDSFSWVEVALLGIALAPTDAALGQAVVKHPNVPETIREGLNAESGLNDGICVPILLLFMAFANNKVGSDVGTEAFILFAKEVGIGSIVGIGIAFLGYRIIKSTDLKNYFSHTWRQVPMFSIAIICFAAAQYLHGSGFIASFIGGLFFGYISKGQYKDMTEISENAGDLLSLVTWVLFGAVILQSVKIITIEIVLFATLSLTAFRMLPVFLSLTGTKLSTQKKLFTGWFGPRGLASIVFAVMILDTKVPHLQAIESTIALTIFGSVLLHGVTANYWSKSLSP